MRRPWAALSRSLVLLSVVLGCTGPTPASVAFDAAPERFTLARLEGQPVYVPCPGGVEGTCSPVLTPGSRAFGRLHRAKSMLDGTSKMDGADRDRGRALVELAWSGTDPRSLDRAVALLEPHDSASIVAGNDLAAAYLTRGILAGRLDDVAKALDLLLQVDRPVEENLFNRAIAMERLGLLTEADVAWSHYLDTSEGGWHQEGVARRDRLRRALAIAAVDAKATLSRAVADSSSNALARIVAQHPQPARELAFDSLLARLPHAGTVASADRLKLLGEGLVDRSVAHIVQSWRARDPTSRASLGSALELFGQGRSAWHGGLYLDALPHFSTVARSAPSPLSWWADVEAGAIHYLQFDFTAALERTGRVLAAADPNLYPSLVARAHWIQGTTRAREGDLEAAWRSLRQAADLLARAGERRNEAFVRSMVGGMLGQLGRDGEALSEKLSAVQRLAGLPVDVDQHSALSNLAVAAANSGWKHTAVKVQEAGVVIALEIGEAWAIAEAEAQLLQLRAARGDTVDPGTIARARRHVAAVADRPSRELALRIVRYAEAQVLLTEHPERAEALLDSVVAFDRAAGHEIVLAEGLLLRARARLSVGRLSEARADLLAAQDVLFRQRASIQAVTRGASFMTAWQRLFDEALRVELHERRDPLAALEVLERSRGLHMATSSGWSDGDLPWADLRPAQGRLFVQYAVLEDEVHRWTLTPDGPTHELLSIGAGDLSGRIDRFVAELRAGAAASRESRELGERLLPSQAWHERIRTVVVVPDGRLNRLPFAALVDPGGVRLIERASVTISQSFASALVPSRAPTIPEGVLVAGDPHLSGKAYPGLAPLPGAEDEIVAVADAYRGGETLRGPTLTRPQLLRRLDDHPVFHFAGHAFFDPTHPQSSHLVLTAGNSGTPDRLYVADLEGAPFQNLRIAVLSSCASTSANDARSGGLSGLALPLLHRGATDVIGTLWPIDDRSAARMIPVLHQQLARGVAAAEALRLAQLAALEGGDDRLGTWAAFQHLGG